MTWTRFKPHGTQTTAEHDRRQSRDAVSIDEQRVSSECCSQPAADRASSTCRRRPRQDFELLGQTRYLGVTKPMLQLVLVSGPRLRLLLRRRAQARHGPGRLQFAGEEAYGFVRNSMGRDIIGSHDFMRFVPYLVALFFFILRQQPVRRASRSSSSRRSRARAWSTASPAELGDLQRASASRSTASSATSSRRRCRPASAGPILLLLVPLEFISNILVRPVTLALRLFANMFAGHLLLILFALGGEYLLARDGRSLYEPVGMLAWVLVHRRSRSWSCWCSSCRPTSSSCSTRMYISGALADEH